MTGAAIPFGEAVQAINAAKAAQASAEDFRRQASRGAGGRGAGLYRVALATEIVRQHDGGAAWTVAQDLARGAAGRGAASQARHRCWGARCGGDGGVAAQRRPQGAGQADRVVDAAGSRGGAGTVAVPAESGL